MFRNRKGQVEGDFPATLCLEYRAPAFTWVDVVDASGSILDSQFHPSIATQVAVFCDCLVFNFPFCGFIADAADIPDYSFMLMIMTM